MSNNTRTQNDGTWVDGYVPPASDWEDLERKIFGSWNGDKGGAYASGAAYLFGGSGLRVTGPTRLTRGGSILSRTFKIRDGAWPLLGEGHGSRSRKIVQAIFSWATSSLHMWTRNHPYVGVGSVALSARATYGRVLEVPDLYVPLRVVDGATLTKVELNFRVATRRVLAPIAMPKFRIVRVHRDSAAYPPEALRATSDGTGFDFKPLVTTPTAWYLDGALQMFEYVCDQNNIIDVEHYSYFAHLVEEQGVLSPDEAFDGIRLVERKADCKHFTNATTNLTGDASLVDGSGLVATSGTAGDRVLVADPDDVLATGATNAASARNGIWLTNAAAWTRAGDLDEQADFTPNWIVKVGDGHTAGGVNQGATWQCQHPSTASRVDLLTSSGSSETKTQPRIVPAEPKGNIYHSLVPHFEVRDLRFQ